MLCNGSTWEGGDWPGSVGTGLVTTRPGGNLRLRAASDEMIRPGMKCRASKMRVERRVGSQRFPRQSSGSDNLERHRPSLPTSSAHGSPWPPGKGISPAAELAAANGGRQLGAERCAEMTGLDCNPVGPRWWALTELMAGLVDVGVGPMQPPTSNLQPDPSLLPPPCCQ